MPDMTLAKLTESLIYPIHENEGSTELSHPVSDKKSENFEVHILGSDNFFF